VTLPLLTPGQNARLTFTGTAGQSVSATLTAITPSTFSSSWTIKILRPSNGSPLPNDGTGCCAYTVAMREPTTLPDNGEYTLVIDPGGTLTGTVAARLYVVIDQTGSIATTGDPVAAAITTPGQTATFPFTGTQDQRVSCAAPTARSIFRRPAATSGW